MAFFHRRFRTYDGAHAPSYVKNGNFVLNKDSIQAQGLVAWWPLVRPEGSINGVSFARDYSEEGANINLPFPATTEAKRRFEEDGTYSVRMDSSSYAEVDKTISAFDTVPYSVASWFWSVNNTSSQVVFGSSDKDVGNNDFGILVSGDVGGDPVRVFSRNTSFVSASTSSGFAASEWQHACGIWRTTALREAYLNGGGKGTETTTVTNTAQDRISVGRLGDSTPSTSTGIFLRDVRIYNYAISEEMVQILADNVLKWDLFYEPGRVKYFLPLAAEAAETSFPSLIAGQQQPVIQPLEIVAY